MQMTVLADGMFSMPRTNSPADPTRRRFLSTVTSVAAGGAVLGMAAIPTAAVAKLPASPLDPIYGIIDHHRAACIAHSAALVEQTRLEELGDRDAGRVAAEPCFQECEAFDRLIETAPATAQGLLDWLAYLDEIRRLDPWKFEDMAGAAEALIVSFSAALQNVTVAS
jgi:hypothetical protein